VQARQLPGCSLDKYFLNPTLGVSYACDKAPMDRPYQLVLDTNVLVSGLRSQQGASYKLLTLLNDQCWQLNISAALVFEYEEILKRDVALLNLNSS
jgi:rRNA-processing protein FCF1